MWQYVDHPALLTMHPPQHIGLSKEMVLGTLTCVNDDSNPSLYPPSKKTRLNFEEIWFHMKNNLDAKVCLLYQNLWPPLLLSFSEFIGSFIG